MMKWVLGIAARAIPLSVLFRATVPSTHSTILPDDGRKAWGEVDMRLIASPFFMPTYAWVRTSELFHALHPPSYLS